MKSKKAVAAFRWVETNDRAYEPKPTRLKRLVQALQRAMFFNGALMAAPLAPEVDDVATLPEFQRGWYAKDPATNKFKVDFAKVDVEDVAGLRNTVVATRKEAADLKKAQQQAIADALKPYEGIDPVATREMMNQFTDKEEAELFKKGKEGWEEMHRRRSTKREAEIAKQLQDRDEQVNGALEVAQTFMDRVLDGNVASVAAELGDVHPSALDDIKQRARNIFNIDDEGNAVQYDEDGETVLMSGKDPKVPYNVKEWLEGMREKAPHWFKNGNTGGGSNGAGNGNLSGANLDGMSPTALLTMARMQGKNKAAGAR